MPSLEALLIFTVAALVMNISPGPSNFYVMARSISQGSRAGVIAALGLASGAMIHSAAAAFGVSALFHSSALAFSILKWVGAAYLIWLGLQHWRALKQAISFQVAEVQAKSQAKIFRESVLVELLNPKTAFFFLAFLPQFADPAAGPLAPQILVLGAIVVVTAIPCDLLVAFASGAVSQKLRSAPWISRAQERVSGTILLLLGIGLAVSERGD